MRLSAWATAVGLLAGIGVIVHETFFVNGERPFLVVVAAGMMGIPFVFRR